MSTIIPLGPQAPGYGPDALQSTPQTQETTPAPANQGYTPIWLVQSGGTQKSFEMLGMRLPQAAGDISAILAEVSLSLEESIDESREHALKASLATLLAALSQFDMLTLSRKIDYETAAIESGTGTLGKINEATAPLETQRNTETQKIETLRDEIASLNAQLKNPDLSAGQRAALTAQRDTKVQQHSAAMVRREAVDLQLADVRITGLETQIRDLETQLGTLQPDSEEAEKIRALIDQKNDRLEAARDHLDAFESGSKSESQRDAFSSSNLSALKTDTAELDARIETDKADLAAAQKTLQDMTYLVVAALAQAASSISTGQARTNNEHAVQDQGLEIAFGLISENLSEAQQAALDALRKTDDSHAAAEDNQRLETLALGIVTSLGDLVATLARLQDDLLPPPNLLPTQGNRVRLDV